MRKLILSITVTAIFLFALCHTASGGRTATDDSGVVTDELPKVEEIREIDSGTDTSGYTNIDGTVEEEEEIRETVYTINDDLNYTWEDEPIRAEVLVEDEDGLEILVVLVPIEDDDGTTIKFVPPSGIEIIKEILVIVEEDVDDEEELTIVVPGYVKVVGETLVVDADGFVIPELEVNVVPEDDEPSDPGESGGGSVNTDPKLSEEYELTADDIYVEEAANLNDVGVDEGLDSDVEILFGDPVVAANSGGHCSMVGSASANPVAFLLMALAFMPLAIKRKK